MDNYSLQPVDQKSQQVKGSERTVKLRTVVLICVAIVILAGIIFVGLTVIKRSPKTINPSSAENAVPSFLFNIYEGKNKLNHPIALSVNKNGEIFVSNNDVHTVEGFSANGQPKYSFGGAGKSGGQFTYPYGIGFLPNGNILVAETGNYRIQELTAQGKYVKTFVDNSNRIGLQKPGPLYVDSKGLIYVGDLSGQQVLVLKQDGTVIRRFGGIQYPHGIAVDPAGKRLFVSDGAINCVKVFSLENNSDKPIEVIGAPGSAVSFSMVRGLAVDQSGHLLVVDTLRSVVLVLDKDGNLLYSLGSWGQDDGQFLYPFGITTDNTGKIYIADWGNNRVQVWGY